jgi:hypothetical protein
MFTKRKSSEVYNYLWVVVFVMLFQPCLNGQVVDSVWARSGDTLILVHKPIVVKEKVVVYAPKPQKRRDPPPRDNHFFMNLFMNNYVDYRKYYDVAPSAQEYVDRLIASTKDGLFYVGYGVGVGYHTNRWILSGGAMMFGFQEKRLSLEYSGYHKRNNGYYYVGARASLGYRIGQNKFFVFPKVEFGVNFYDRTDGWIIDTIDYTKLMSADRGIVNGDSKFSKQVKTIGPAVNICYRLNDNYLFYLEPFYNKDIDNSIKSNELYAMKRNYWGCRLGVMFYFF